MDAEIKNWYIPQGVDPKKLRNGGGFLIALLKKKDEAREKS